MEMRNIRIGRMEKKMEATIVYWVLHIVLTRRHASCSK